MNKHSFIAQLIVPKCQIHILAIALLATNYAIGSFGFFNEFFKISHPHLFNHAEGARNFDIKAILLLDSLKPLSQLWIIELNYVPFTVL
jgi:hypothetical protein